jgi:hypothetical protein
MELADVLDDEYLRTDRAHSIEEVLPQTVELRPAQVVAIPTEGTESLARRPADDQVGFGIVGPAFDVAVEDLAPEVASERRRGCALVLNSEHRHVAQVGEVEAEAEAARPCEEVDTRDRPVRRVRRMRGMRIDGRSLLEHRHLLVAPSWSHGSSV